MSERIPKKGGRGEQTAHQPLLDKPMFVAHGSKDELIPLPRAQEGVRTLENAGGGEGVGERWNGGVGRRRLYACDRLLLFEIF